MKPVALKAPRSRVVVSAANPPDVPKTSRLGSGREWLSSLFAKFGPIQDRAKNVTVLDFEKPLVELDNRINEVRNKRKRSEFEMKFKFSQSQR